ncbi:MAG: T9SS type A sorting domain-containing protein [candidate division WOR-3 bacterium]|nr:MAG: T9SS type A sorting domain-containing protein [candidate division WOR-3 bacterium]
MDNILTSLGYTGEHSLDLFERNSDLGVYKTIFVCVGIYANNYVIGATSDEATALVNYLNTGGRMYLEGGDVWYYDPQYVGGYNFGPLFGINAVGDGSTDLYTVVGQSATFTEGMNYSYSGENSFMDHLKSTGTGFTIFRNANNSDTVGVANDAETHMTVGTSFELGGLVDATGVSTKAALLDSIMHFFGIFSTGVEEITKSDVITPKLALYPNPFSKKTDIRYQITDNSQKISLKIFDIAGRLVRQFDDRTIRQSNHITWDAKDNSGRRVSSGIYFVHLEVENQRQVAKIILLE